MEFIQINEVIMLSINKTLSSMFYYYYYYLFIYLFGFFLLEHTLQNTLKAV